MNLYIIVDDRLEALGAPKEYQRLRNWIIRIIRWITYVFYQLAYLNFLAFFVLNYDINFTCFFSMSVVFLKYYPSNVSLSYSDFCSYP